MSSHNLNSACDEFRILSRRGFLGAGALGLTLPSLAVARPAASASRDTLVFIFLRGGMDGLTAVVPYGDDELYNLRPGLAIPPPGSGGGAVDLDGFFGLAPAAGALLEPYRDGKLAIVHAAGSTDPTRSHFDQMKFIEAAIPNNPDGDLSSGWLGRHLERVPPLGGGDLRGISLGTWLPLTLAGGPQVLPIEDPTRFGFYGHSNTQDARKDALQRMYASSFPLAAGSAIATLGSFELIEDIDFEGYAPEHGADYPDSDFGKRLRSTAAMIKAEPNFEAFEVDYGGWDDHDDQGPVNGNMANRLYDFARGLKAFSRDLSDELHRVTVVAMSEFGRRADENGSGGTDHGRGGVMFVLGGHVHGDRVHGNWPGLAPNDLDDYALEVTTDYRDVLAEVLAERLDSPDLGTVFPNHNPNYLGLTY